MSSNNEPSKSEDSPRDFAVILAGLAQGEANIEATKSLHDLVKNCKMISLKKGGAKVSGAITVTVPITVEAKNVDYGYVTMGYDVKIKEPKPVRQGDLMFSAKGGSLVREDPRQQKLALRDVSKDGAPRDIDDDESEEARSV